MSGFDEYFKRQIELLGEDVQKDLKNKSIAIVGCGGLGCSLAVALGSSGIGKIHLIDFDRVAYHNIHRQIAFKLEDIDKPKCEVLKDFILSRCEFVDIEAHFCSFEEFCSLDEKFDLLLDATDNIPIRVTIDEKMKRLKTPWIYASVEEFNAQICFFDKSCFSSFAQGNIKPKGVAAPMVMQAASFEANLALRFLCGLEIERDRLYYLSYSSLGEFKVDSFSMPV